MPISPTPSTPTPSTPRPSTPTPSTPTTSTVLPPYADFFSGDLVFANLDLSRNKIEINIEAADPAITERFWIRYFLEIWIEDGFLGTWTQLATLEASEVPPYFSGDVQIFEGAYFPIENYLDSLLHYDLPEKGQTEVSMCPDVIRKYKVKKIVKNGETVLSEVWATERHVLKGGIDEVDFVTWKDVLFSDKTIGLGGKFLTWNRTNRTIREDEEVFLYAVMNSVPNPSAITVRVEASWKVNGAIVKEVTTRKTIDGIQGFGVYCVPVGVKALGLDADTRELVRYEVWLGSTLYFLRITEKIAFEVATDYERNERYVLYSNNLGGFDTLRLVGRGAEKMSVTRDESERYVPFGADATYSERIVNEVTGEKELLVSTGYLDKEGIEKLRELLLAREIYFVTEKGFLPMRNLNNELIYLQDDVWLDGRNLVFGYVNRQYNYSGLGTAPASIQRATAWRGFGVPTCIQDVRGMFSGYGVFPKIEKYYVDNEQSVVPRIVKDNILGREGYIGAVLTNACAVTPFVNDAISRASTFRRNNCAVGYLGNYPTITIAAGLYGSAISKADANLKAEAAWLAQNTQTNANGLGVCTIGYTKGVVGEFWKLTQNARNFELYDTTAQHSATTEQINFNSYEGVFIYPIGNGWNNNYLARWKGQIKAKRSGTIKFKIEHDEGVIFKIANATLVDNFLNGTFVTYCQHAMTAGQYYDFELKYYENNIAGHIRLFWETATGSNVYELVNELYRIP